MALSLIRKFTKMESAGGISLVVTAIIAMIVANTALLGHYEKLLDVPFTIALGDFKLSKPVLLWINDGLMAIFFLLVGLEIKREMVEGELSKISQVVLPGLAAIGGMAAPALIYAALNRSDPDALAGWAIPAATDIAFALGVLALLGKRVPLAMKVFLLTVAIFDDLGAIIIIALFYSGDLSMVALAGAGVATAVLIVMNLMGVTRTGAFIIVGLILWVCVLKSGVHATLAGVVTALTIPMRDSKQPDHSPVKHLEHALHYWVAFAVLPLFAFANAGVPLKGLTAGDLLEPIPLGIALGLLIGKIVGIVGISALAVSCRIAKLPNGVNWPQMIGVGALCGIGFTMSLFISGLAFEHTGADYFNISRLGILGGSIIAGILGYIILTITLPKQAAEPATEPADQPHS